MAALNQTNLIRGCHQKLSLQVLTCLTFNAKLRRKEVFLFQLNKKTHFLGN